jgi:uncharacterized protein YciI
MADPAPQFLYRLQVTRLEMLRGGPTPEEARVVGAHLNYLKNLAEEGVVVLAGRTQTNDETTFGIVILNAADEAAARAVMDNDPAVKGSVMHATLFPFRVAVHSAK